MKLLSLNKWTLTALALAVAAAAAAIAAVVWFSAEPSGSGPAFVSGNGSIEATDIDIATSCNSVSKLV